MIQNKKIIFAGLDNSGKTSIIFSLQKKFSCLDSKPTIGISRSNLKVTKCMGFQFSTWDLGGQEKFRENHIKNKNRVFDRVETLFYVVDILDSSRFEDSLAYFSAIIEILNELHENPRIVICLHKFDPDLREDLEIISTYKKLSQNFQNLRRQFKISIFQTSIHDNATIIKAFSEGVIQGTPKSSLIGNYLKEFAKLTFSSAVVLMDESSLIIGSHSTNEKYLEICETVAPRFITAMDRLENYCLHAQNVIVNVAIGSEDSEKAEEFSCDEAMLFVRSFDTDDSSRFNIITLSRNKRTYKLSDDYLPKLAIQLSDLIDVMN